MIHFCGVIFYAMFASGELQPWAEPSWEHGVGGTIDANAGQPPPGTTTLPPGQTAMVAAAPGVDPNNSTNPFGAPNGYGANYGATTADGQQYYPTTTEYGQPPATDAYLHGGIQDRSY